MTTDNLTRQTQRQARIRKKLRRNPSRVRLSIHRSNQYVSAQIIDDAKGVTITAVSEKQLKAGSGSRM
jgi:large subunit ribosomal protein L18